MPAVLHLHDRRAHKAAPKPAQQSGVLAYRKNAAGMVEILVLKKPHARNWGIPKGNQEEHLSLADNAAKEAFEEAGISGLVRKTASGSYRALKRVCDQQIVIEVWVFLMDVEKQAADWPEKSKREIQWLSPAEAALVLREPLLADLCRSLATP